MSDEYNNTYYDMISCVVRIHTCKRTCEAVSRKRWKRTHAEREPWATRGQYLALSKV